jgi:hypothetical protein
MHERDIPPHLTYIVSIAEKYGVDEAQEEGFLRKRVDEFQIEDFAALANLYNEIRLRGDVERLSAWFYAIDTDRCSATWRTIFILFLLFDNLEARGIVPFSSGEVHLSELRQDRLDWSKLPAELSYLADPAARYGIYQSDDEVEQFCDVAEPSEIKDLARLAERIRNDSDAIEAWMDRNPMTKNREAALVYFMQGVIDRLGLFG